MYTTGWAKSRFTFFFNEGRLERREVGRKEERMRGKEEKIRKLGRKDERRNSGR